jgi:hypothetical protein
MGESIAPLTGGDVPNQISSWEPSRVGTTSAFSATEGMSKYHATVIIHLSAQKNGASTRSWCPPRRGSGLERAEELQQLTSLLRSQLFEQADRVRRFALVAKNR